MTDYPIYGLYNSSGVIWHSVIKLPDGRFQDASGVFEEKDLLKNFPELGTVRLKEITQDDLSSVRPINSDYILKAKKFLSILFPEYSENSFEKRSIKFLQDLEELSKKHGLWIRGNGGAIVPHIADLHSDENPYYEARHTDDGMGIVFDRKFK